MSDEERRRIAAEEAAKCIHNLSIMGIGNLDPEEVGAVIAMAILTGSDRIAASVRLRAKDALLARTHCAHGYDLRPFNSGHRPTCPDGCV